MATTTWLFTKDTLTGTDFTNKVLSASINGGREKYLDPYSGGNLIITINNTGNYATNFTFNTKVFAQITSPGTYEDCWVVQDIQYNDYPGNIGFPTATLTCVDALARAGRIQAQGKTLTQALVYDQGAQFNSTNGGPLPADLLFYGDPFTGTSTASAQTYTGTVLNQLNLLNSTERGILRTGSNELSQQVITGFARTSLADKGAPIVLGRTYDSATIGYQEFERIQNGLSFFNTATVISAGNADQTATNSSSVTTYGSAFYSSTTVDYNATQAFDNASWIANGFSDPAALRYKIRFIDKPQNATPYQKFVNQFPGLRWELAYRLPGASVDIETAVMMEGWTINMTPEQTSWSLSFSPKAFYEYFTLNNTQFGILDSSRLGWK